MNFAGRTALVTGAAIGIGRAVALMLAQHGAKLVLVDINAEKLECVRQEILAITQDVATFVCNVSDEARVNEVCAHSLEQFGRIDILVNNAAIWRTWKPFLEVDTHEWLNYLNINVMNVVYFTRALLPAMLENQWGRIINVASVAGVYGNANMVHYSATKGAVIAMTKALAKEVTDKGVLVNAVSPGSVSPSTNEDVTYVQPSELSFMGRTGSDQENANLICFLASDEASYISGQNIQIDGCRRKQ